MVILGSCFTGLNCVAGQFLLPEEDSGPDAVTAGDVSPGTSRSHDQATESGEKAPCQRLILVKKSIKHNSCL